jgi:hypothetical protein
MIFRMSKFCTVLDSNPDAFESVQFFFEIVVALL